MVISPAYRLHHPERVPLTVAVFNALVREARLRLASDDALDAVLSRHPTLPQAFLRDKALFDAFRAHEPDIRAAFTDAMEVALFGASRGEVAESWAMDTKLPETLKALEQSLDDGFARVEAHLEELFAHRPALKEAARDVYAQISVEMQNVAVEMIGQERFRKGNGR